MEPTCVDSGVQWLSGKLAWMSSDCNSRERFMQDRRMTLGDANKSLGRT